MVKFNTKDRPEFFRTVLMEVDKYFQKTKKSRFGGIQIFLKSAWALGVFWGAYALVLYFGESAWSLVFCALLGFGMAQVGMNVMHDANHKSFSRKNYVNRIFQILGSDLVGVSSFNWRVKHNLLHHTFTNIHGHDEDIQAPEWLLRFDPHTPLYKAQKIQHLYAPLFYGVVTIPWIFWDDFRDIFRYKNEKTIQIKSRVFWEEFSLMLFFKLSYVAFIFLIPVFVVGISFWWVLLGFLIVQFVCGLFLAHVFQLAHVVERTKIVKPPITGSLKNHWAIHQLLTTFNFSPGSKIANFLTGGLNHQVEHHLFPTISHVHYPELSKIIKKTTKKFNLPYCENKTFWSGLMSHYRLLKRLGREKNIPDLNFDH